MFREIIEKSFDLVFGFSFGEWPILPETIHKCSVRYYQESFGRISKTVAWRDEDREEQYTHSE